MRDGIEVEVERYAGECADCNEVRRLNDRASRLEVEAHNLRQDAEVARRQHMRRILRAHRLKDEKQGWPLSKRLAAMFDAAFDEGEWP